jgi:hypothetical protein
MQTVLHSRLTNAFLAKGWGPLLCILGASVVFSGNFLTRNLLLACPFLVGALFGVSVASVEVRDGVLRYRRLFRWREIPKEEIVDARVELPPVVGSIRLKRLLFPWGRLYFALDANLSANPFREGKYPLLSYICSQKKPILESQDSAKPYLSKKGATNLKLIGAAVAGASLASLERILFSGLASQHALSPPARLPQAPLLGILDKIGHFMAIFEVQVVFFVAFLFLAVFKRRQPTAWLFAFLAGFSLPYILFRLLTIR